MFLLFLIIPIWILLLFRVSFKLIGAAVAFSLAAYAKIYQPSLLFIIGLYLPIILIMTITFLPFIRKRLISVFVQKWVHKILPPISNTEREAIAAGDVWIESNLFKADFDLKKHLKSERYQLTEEENNFINGPVQKFCEMINDWEIVQKDWALQDNLWTFLKENKFFGLIIPKSYGGLGFSATAHSTIVAKIATKSPSAAVVAMVPNSLGPAELLIHYGTEDQKNYYLPRLAQGQDIPCFALTGIEAGSDAGAMTDFGVVCYGQHEGKETLGMRITWNKRYITLAPVATVVGLAFKLFDPDHLIGQTEELGITVCLIPASHPGVEIGRRHNPLGMAFPNGPTKGKDVFIPMEWIIGGQSMVGQGWRMLMECLSVGRGISLPALGTAIGHYCSKVTPAYAKVRFQFKTSIGEFEGIQDVLGKIGGLTYILEATRLQTSGAIDAGFKPSVISAISKYHMTDMGRTIINDAMDIQGGKGIILGPRNLLGHAYMACPISITVEGANILTRSLMIFGQGAIRCHPYLLKEMEASADLSKLKEFDKALFGHLAYSIGNAIRGITLGWTGALFAIDHSGYYLKKYTKRLQLLSHALSVASDLSFAVLGGDLKRKESLSARLGDMLSHLYMASAVMYYHHNQKDMALHEDFAQWSLEYNTYQAQQAFIEFCHNFTSPVIGKILLMMFFPYGAFYKKPTDKLTHKLAKRMLKNDPIMSQLTSLVPNACEGEPLHTALGAFESALALEDAMKRVARYKKTLPRTFDKKAEEVYQLAQAAGIISKTEYEGLLAFEKMKYELIMTDDFSFNEFARKGAV